MVQNIRPPQVPQFPLRESESGARPVRSESNKVAVDSGTSTPAATPTREQIEQAASRVSEVLRGRTSRVEINIDPDLHQAVIKIFNGESGEVIRQIPSEELVELAKYLDQAKGLLVSEQA